jgi:hypothetical protein
MKRPEEAAEELKMNSGVFYRDSHFSCRKHNLNIFRTALHSPSLCPWNLELHCAVRAGGNEDPTNRGLPGTQFPHQPEPTGSIKNWVCDLVADGFSLDVQHVCCVNQKTQALLSVDWCLQDAKSSCSMTVVDIIDCKPFVQSGGCGCWQCTFQCKKGGEE